TLTVTNHGPSTATGVTVSDPVPAHTTFVSATPSQGTCTPAVSCSLGTLASGASQTINIGVHVKDTASGRISNTATVSGEQPDAVAANNSDSEDTAVVHNADLSTTTSDSHDPFLPDTLPTYTLTVTNHGPSTATGV